jgi:hypothetical protein
MPQLAVERACEFTLVPWRPVLDYHASEIVPKCSQPRASAEVSGGAARAAYFLTSDGRWGRRT